MMKHFDIMKYSAQQDHVSLNGTPIKKGATTKLVLTDMTYEEIQVAEKNNLKPEHWAAAIFPITPKFDAESQEATAKLLQNYLNKVAEAQEKARLGAEIGFLN